MGRTARHCSWSLWEPALLRCMAPFERLCSVREIALVSACMALFERLGSVREIALTFLCVP